MFEKATRLKLRFDHKGVCSVEDLWDIPLKSLDILFMKLNGVAKERKEESLLTTQNSGNTKLELQIEIIKHIVGVRLSEKLVLSERKEKAVRKQKLMEIVEEKQDAATRNMSIEEITKLISEL